MKNGKLSGRAAVRATTTAAACVALTVGAVPATAATPPKPPDPIGALGKILHPELDFAGAQIAKIEGVVNGALKRTQGKPQGLDVSSHQGSVNWPDQARQGAQFAYVKATEGITYRNPHFAEQYNGSFATGLTRGAYHFALPDVSGGVRQADYFVSHGGGWSRDGKTLPPAVDLEYNPYGQTCYGLSPRAMVSWVKSFSDRVHSRTGRYPTIYTSTRWWNMCTNGSGAFARTNPLWIPRYGSSVGALPGGFQFHTFWQYANHGKFAGDQNVFNGSSLQLAAIARG